MQISCIGPILKTEDDIEKEWDCLQKFDSKLDGFPLSDDSIVINRDLRRRDGYNYVENKRTN